LAKVLLPDPEGASTPTSIVEVASRIGLPRRDPDGRSKALDRNGEHISYTAFGLDDARRARVAFELAPQAKNLHVDAAIAHAIANGLSGVVDEVPLRRCSR
jgi:hypothetical protein